MQNFLTPEIITAFLSLIAMIVITQLPQFANEINAIVVAVTGFIIALIGSSTFKQISEKQEFTKIEIAKMQINELRTYNAIREQINNPKG